MKIVIVSDTHMPRMAKQLPMALTPHLSNADAIIHAGDWQDKSVYEKLVQYAPVYGVTGNVDEEWLHRRFTKKILLKIDNVRIGVTHGDGKGKTTEQRAMDLFSQEAIDILIFGHSHIPLKKDKDGMILFNPGSPTDKRRQQQYSFGLLEINDKSYTISHLFFDSKK
ncbi:metallophosphoesterase [Jeotgalibacillus sp. S-D1]|uniref:metallophosphoesterase family protein n=1 Tax=Jeotgalibacillus sp. S-D1 TaxID=2552189 RepID=UPI00105AA383|nr:metallophosphoesterase [Jeotgalibacillus sp. S-D1]TDL31391.1 metallophosphoesterase [Jeotgalibacillus sp. S-D1]